MAGIAKPNVEGLRGTAQYAVIGVLGGQGSGGTISNTGLLNGVQVNEWNTANVMYFYTTGNYIEIDIFTYNVNIWRSGTTSWKTYTAPLKIEKWNGTSYDDVTTLYPQTVTAITETQWEKTISNLPKGRYKFSYNGSARLDSEWYIENININKILILDNGLYKKWNIATSKLETVTSTQPNESDFIDNGNEKSDLELIPSDVWELLVNHDVKVVEYTDNPNQVESVLTIETEQFSFYDEMGDSVDILYYTDNPEKTSANLEITHNYSPLDDLDGDFDVITYTDNEDMERIELNIEALPTGQIVIDNKDIKLYGLLNQVSANRYDDNLLNGVIKLLMSFDSGNTWYSFNNDKWIIADVSSELDFINKGIKYDDVVKITNSDFSKVSAQNKVRLAYYLDESIRDDAGAKISNIKTVQNQALDTPILNDASFYIVNTVSTINLTLSGKLIDGKIDDVDGGKVKYKVSLNGQPYYPKDGSYTDFSLTPLDISLRLSNDDVLINNQNTLRVDIMDYWGETDFWETTFIGKYNGLMFSDINGDYYSDDVGKIIKYLDFGTLIAGQVSTESEIKVFNTYGYPVKNLTISSTNNYEGVVIELSKTTNPFLANDTLLWSEEMADGESKTFFVRIVTNYTTPPVSGGMFEIRVDADQV